MQKRGPDAEGYWTNESNYTTGFVRLAIRDLSEAANQPMVSSCGNYVLSYNGELYNCDLLKQNLLNHSIDFKTTSDTEILLYCLIHLDLEVVLNTLDGMFAFAFYEVRQARLTLARDRAGIKPLYLGILDSGLVYSSDYKHIVQHPGIRNNAISEEAIGTFLQLGFIPDGMGFLQNTLLFPHGHYLQMHGKEWSMHPYWAFPVTAKTPETNDNPDLEKTLAASVESQMINDVPLGTFLSGGVDAPLITQAAVQKDPNLTAFTIGVEDARTDESKEASWYARKFGVQQQIKVINPDQLAQLLSQSDLAFSEPFADYSSLPTLLLAGLARASVKVALSGDGADELFWGYSRNVRIQQNYDLMLGSHFQRFLRWSKGKLLGSKRRISTRELGYHDFTAYAYSTLFITGALKWVPRIFKGKPGKPLFLQSCKAASSEKWPAETEAMQLLRKLEFDLHLQRILLKVDRASMAESLEVRVPFLSNAMIDYAIQCKPETCIVDGQGKYPLKKHLSDLSGNQQAFASKKGFTIPLSKWIKTELKEEIAQTILPLPAVFAPYFDQKEVEKLFESHIRDQEDAAWIIWSLYTLVRWHNHTFSPAS